MTTALRRPLVPLTLAAALFLSGCSLGAPAQFEESASPAPAQSASGDDDAAAEQVADDSASAAGINPGDLGDPIAVSTIPAVVEGDPEATMDVALLDLRRDGDTVLMNISFRVNSEDGQDNARWIYHYLGGQIWQPHLIDSTNLTRYDVLGIFPNQAATNSQGSMFSPGQTFYAYAAFAAPPADVESLNVQLVDGAPLIMDVQLR